ncbi:MAG TPA: flagellar hook-basal body complex protein FliE [Clostridiaceae bacterium]|nr:flagellar hook-basal body complex protein FliE [Clostridiaceae bacterium]
MAIQGINSVGSMASVPVNTAGKANESVNFKDLLIDALNNVNALEQESARMTEDFIAGRTDNIHSVLIAGEKASISLQFVMEVRNKVLEAYQEIMRMQI